MKSKLIETLNLNKKLVTLGLQINTFGKSGDNGIQIVEENLNHEIAKINLDLTEKIRSVYF
jgi:hypothetical protein